MKILLQDEESILEITDDGFDSALTWLKLSIKNKDTPGLEKEIELPLKDLMGAIIGFDAKNNRPIQED